MSETVISLSDNINKGDTIRFYFSFDCPAFVYCPSENGMLAFWADQMQGEFNPKTVHFDFFHLINYTGYVEGTIEADGMQASDVANDLTSIFNANTTGVVNWGISSVARITAAPLTEQVGAGLGNLVPKLPLTTSAGLIAVAILLFAIFLLMRQVRV